MGSRGGAIPSSGCGETGNGAYGNGQGIRCSVGYSHELQAQKLRRRSAVNTRTFFHPDPADQCVGGVVLWDSGGQAPI